MFGEPGWKIIHLEPFGDHMGEMAWEKDDRMVNTSWYPEKEYADRRQDKPKGAEMVKVGELTGWMTGLGDGSTRVITEPRAGDGVFASLDSPPGLDRAQFKVFLAEVRTVGVEAWIAAASSDVTRSGEAGDRAYRLFAQGGLPRPPNWDDAMLDRIPAGDVREFDTALAKQSACGWLTEWQRARAAGDVAARAEAGRRLLSSAEWPVLVELERQGSTLRTTISGIAEKVVNGGASDAQVEEHRRTLC